MDYPCRAVQKSTFLCNIVKIDSFNDPIREYLNQNINSLFIFVPTENRQNYQIVDFQIIHVNTNGTMRMFWVLILVFIGQLITKYGISVYKPHHAVGMSCHIIIFCWNNDYLALQKFA